MEACKRLLQTRANFFNIIIFIVYLKNNTLFQKFQKYYTVNHGVHNWRLRSHVVTD
jgi:hypothetical protein